MKPLSPKTSHLQLTQLQLYTLSHCQCRQSHHTWVCGQDRIDSTHVMSSRAYSTVLHKHMLLRDTTLHGHTRTWHPCENWCMSTATFSQYKIKSVSKHKTHTDICTRDGMPNHAYSVSIVKHAYYPLKWWLLQLSCTLVGDAFSSYFPSTYAASWMPRPAMYSVHQVVVYHIK